jgi:hypothetical protein
MFSHFIRLTFVLLTMAFIPIGQSHFLMEQATGGALAVACTVDSANPTTTFCTGSKACSNVGLTHYSWSWFSGENDIVSASVFCSAYVDNSVTPPITCGGSAQADVLAGAGSCTPNF